MTNGNLSSELEIFDSDRRTGSPGCGGRMARKKIEDGLDPEERRRTLRRLGGYLLRYRTRLLLGITFSLFASFSNLFSISAFIPIFNALGESGGVVRVFDMGGEELDRHDRFIHGEEMPFYEEWMARWTGFKRMANDWSSGKSIREVIFLISGLILPLYFLKLIFVTLTIYFIGTTGYLAVRDLREDLYRKIHTLGLDFFSRERTGIIMSRVINDVELIGRSLSMELTDSLNNVFYVVTHFILLALISLKMLMITFVIVPLVSSPMSKITKVIRRAATQQQETLAELGAHVQEVISGIRVIRAFSMEKFESSRFEKVNHHLFNSTFRLHYNHQVGPALTEFIATGVVLGFLSWGATSIADGELSRGMFFAFFFTLIFIMRPLKQLSVLANLTSTSVAAAARIFQLLETETIVRDRGDALPFRGIEKGIRFEGVSFTYPGSDRPALQRIDLEIPAGKTYSIVGSSGAGKSTLADLLPRFYDVTEGRILVDDVDLRDYRLKELRTSFGIVTQNIFLFNASVRENIAYGRNDVPLEKVIEVARAANAHEFIESLPDGYETGVGERGVMLSGGQRQRLAIARALLRNPSILIFDEATSALDNESEKLVQEAMDRLRQGRTVLVIAHRLSTVYRSDQILVMEDGQILDRGTHSELLKTSAVYQKLYEMQFAE